MRLEILYHYGGVYIDITIEKRKNLTSLLDHKDYKFCISNEVDDELDQQYMSTGFIVSIPHHKFLKKLLSVKVLNAIDLDMPANKCTGPYFVRKYMKKN